MTTGDDTRQPWDRQPGETAPAWAAFVAYRDLGPGDRSLRRVGQELGKSASLMSRWSAEHEWVARVAAFDGATARAAEAAVMAARRSLAARHVRTAGKALARVEQMIDALPAEAPAVADVVKLWTAAADIERAALSIPSRVELSGPGGGPVKVAGWTDEERLERLVSLHAEVAARIGDRLGLLNDPAQVDDDEPDDQPDSDQHDDPDAEEPPAWWLDTDDDTRDDTEEHP